MVARRAHNPKVAWFKSRLRNQKRKHFERSAFSFLERCGPQDWMVPQTSYWLYDDEKPIGYGRIRHCLNDNLAKTSGHIGYAIRQTERKKGYGTKILPLLLEECKKLNIKQVQIGANSKNIASNRIIVKNGGILFRSAENKNFYHVNLV